MTKEIAKNWLKLLLGGLLCFGTSLMGFVTAYYYSWRITAPGLPVEMVSEYDSIARAVGLMSIALFMLSLVLIPVAIWRKKSTR